MNRRSARLPWRRGRASTSRCRASPGGWTSCGSSSLCVRSARSLCVRSTRNGVRAIDAQVLVLQFRVARAQECLRVQSAYEWVSACAVSKEECLHGTCVPQSWQGDGKPELNDAAAPAGTCLCLLIRRTVRGRLVMTEGGGAGPPRQYWSSLSAAPKCCSPAATPPSIRRSHARAGTVRCGPCGVLVRGLGRQPEIGLNKPANLSARGRGYRWDTIRY